MKPMIGWRRKYQAFLKAIYGRVLTQVSGVRVVDEDNDFDYSYYLG